MPTPAFLPPLPPAPRAAAPSRPTLGLRLVLVLCAVGLLLGRPGAVLTLTVAALTVAVAASQARHLWQTSDPALHDR